MNLIILEGPDGGGKTTLARELERLGYRYVHHGPPEPGENIFRRDLAAIIGADGPTVIDRLHLSERIYGNVCRGGSPITELHERLVERLLNAQGGQVVLCLPPWRTTLANWLKNIDNEYVRREVQLVTIQAMYVEHLYSKRPYLWFDYTRQRVGAFAELLRAGENYSLPTWFVGSPGARFLLVGDRANSEPDLPFMSVDNCSGYLHACLDDAGFEEQELAFANAVRRDGRWETIFDDDHAWTYVALGHVAHKVLDGQNVPHQLLPHPQYWKRFHAGERNDYVERLRKLRREAP